ncbi:MAG: hypothetical protein ACI8RZ_003693 [Myxococcota bacterium]|jgi:hypothetical protein
MSLLMAAPGVGEWHSTRRPGVETRADVTDLSGETSPEPGIVESFSRSGSAWIRMMAVSSPDGDGLDAEHVYCDQTSDGGGWTLLSWTGDSDLIAQSTEIGLGHTAAAISGYQNLEDYTYSGFCDYESTVFPAPKNGGVVIVRYPFVFEPR